MGQEISKDNVLSDSVKARAHSIALEAVQSRAPFSNTQKQDIAQVAALKQEVRKPGSSNLEMRQAIRNMFRSK